MEQEVDDANVEEWKNEGDPWSFDEVPLQVRLEQQLKRTVSVGYMVLVSTLYLVCFLKG